MTSRPAVTPIIAKGIVRAMTRGGRKALNSATTTKATITMAGMTPGISDFCDFAEDSISPPHSMTYPAGSSVASTLLAMLFISVGRVTPAIGLA